MRIFTKEPDYSSPDFYCEAYPEDGKLHERMCTFQCSDCKEGSIKRKISDMQKQKQVMYRLRLYAGPKRFIDVPLMFASPRLANNWGFDMTTQDKGITAIEIIGSNNMFVKVLKRDLLPVEVFEMSRFRPIPVKGNTF